MPLIDFFLNKILEYTWESIWCWRIATFLLLLLQLFGDKIFKKKDIIDHDKRIYLESKEIMPSRTLDSILNEIYGEHLRENDLNILIAYIYFFKDQENNYLIKRLTRKLKVLIYSLDLLCKFIGKHFSYTEINENISFFEPNKKNDPKYYDVILDLREEKDRLIKNVDVSYKEYMISVKKILKT